MKTNESITITCVDDKKNLNVTFNGELSYQDSIAMSNALVVVAVRGFLDHLATMGLTEEQLEHYKTVAYDDLNLRFTNLLEPVTPKEIETSFTEEAIAAMQNEDEYINLKFKAMQYDKVVESAKDNNKNYAKVNVQENGEFVI